MSAICAVLGIARRTAYYVVRARPGGRYHRAADATVLQQIRAVTNSRATYGYRRVWAMVNRTFRAGYNRKRIRRVMQLNGLMLAPRVHRRHGRPHVGQIQLPTSNQRWCSDVFLIPCWSGEVISVAFAIDCHDREVPAFVASPRPLTGADIRTLMDRMLWARFGEATLKAPHAVQWLSDNGPQYTATATVLYAHELGLVPITTPAYSPESNGLAEAFVGTFKRDYVIGAELRDAETVLAQLGGLDRRLQHPGAPFGARDAEPGRLPGWRYTKLLAVSRRLGSIALRTPIRAILPACCASASSGAIKHAESKEDKETGPSRLHVRLMARGWDTVRVGG
jgi:transposase InsO family protein